MTTYAARVSSSRRAAADAARPGEPFLGKVLAWILAAPVVLPLVVWSGLVYPYLVPKTLLFYALSLVAAAVFVLAVSSGVPFFWNRLTHWSAWVPLALVVLAYVASYFGYGFYHSFWSLFVRGDGLLMLTCAVADFYCILLYAERAFFERFVEAVAVVGTVVAVYGIGEWVMNGGRIGSLLGNAAFFAGYLGIALFATLVAARMLTGRARTAFAVGAGLEVIAIVLTATRGTVLALGVASVATLAYFAWAPPSLSSEARSPDLAKARVREGEGARKRWSAITLVAIVVFGSLFFVFRAQIAQVPFAPIARVASISTSEADVASRLFIWKHMLGEIAARPLLGVGTEHIDVLFNTFYDPTQIQEQWFDRSHNAFIDYAVQYGVGGFILYVLLIGSFLVAARRLATNGERCLAGFFVLLPLVYVIQNFFVFDTISSFWLLLALLAAALAATDHGEKESLELARWVPYGGWLSALVLVVLIYPVSIRPLEAAYNLAQAYAYQLSDPARSVAYLKNGFALGTYGNLEYGYEAFDMYANTEYGVLTGDALVAAYDESKAILTEDFNRYPYDARTALDLAQVLSIPPPSVPEDTALLSSALARTIKESPKRTQSWYILVNLSIAEANTYPIGSNERAAGYAAAKDLLTKYIALVPTLSEPHYALADILLATGDRPGAVAEAALGKQYYVRDTATAKRAAQFYEEVQDFPNAAFFLKEVSVLDPSDYPLVYDLAKVEYLLGNKAAAEQVVQGLRTNDPSILGSDPNFLQAITAYEKSL